MTTRRQHQQRTQRSDAEKRARYQECAAEQLDEAVLDLVSAAGYLDASASPDLAEQARRLHEQAADLRRRLPGAGGS